MGLEQRIFEQNAWERGGRGQPGIKNGISVERGVLGVVRGKFDGGESETPPFDEVIKWVKEHQPDLKDRSKIAAELRTIVANLCVKKDIVVRFFTTVGSPLDIHYGVDAIIEQGENIVTIDLSLRDKDYFKADVLFKATIDEEGQVVVSEEEINYVAGQIASRLNVPYQAAA